MNNGGAQTNKLEIKQFSKNDRGVIASADIEKGEMVLFVPTKQIITFETVCNTSIGKQMMTANMLDRYGIDTFFCQYILQELNKPHE
jgi:hypothetical protein